MSTASYTSAYSATQSPELGYIIGNKLKFAGEQSKIIYNLCLEQVSACQYHQKKFTRLEKNTLSNTN